jgi:mannose-6-phosphate isomerase
VGSTVSKNSSPAKLAAIPPRFVERIWGTTKLSPWFPDQTAKIGEVWFTDEISLLVKFIFTEDDLSVQVHPNDEQAAACGLPRGKGKTEMWHILSRDPGARLALGLNKSYSREEVERSIAETRLESLLAYVPVEAGENYFVSAGTIHAIGRGIRLCEIQQLSDITYRLYDYGRGRELHVEQGLAVSKFEPYDGKRSFPVECSHFGVREVEGSFALKSGELLILLEGAGTLNGDPVLPGTVWRAASNGTVRLDGTLRALAARGEV